MVSPRLTRRCVLASGAAAPLLLAAPAAQAAPQVGRVLARGLSVPWGLAFLPGGDAVVTERPTGRVFRVRAAGGKRLIGMIGGTVDFGEGGLLGVAVSPTFATDRWLYFYLTTDRDNRVIRRRYRGGELGAPEVLLDGIARTYQGSQNHHGGRLAFSPSGHLFVSTGDAGLGSRSQDDDSLNGKILRLTRDGGVPPDNPIRGNPMWAKGFRNVQGLAWDSRGLMWATEFGQQTRDELNRIRKGRNYGWPDVEGGDGAGPYADPFVTWTPTSICSPSGLAIANGRAWVGALAGRSLYSVKLTDPGARRKARFFRDRFGRIRTVVKEPGRNALWITTGNGSGDRVIRIRLA